MGDATTTTHEYSVQRVCLNCGHVWREWIEKGTRASSTVLCPNCECMNSIMYEQHKVWEARQEFYANESAKAQADIKAREEGEMSEIKEVQRCCYCDKPADAAMLSMGKLMAHDTCVIRKLNELLDPDYDGTGEPLEIVIKKYPAGKWVKLADDQSLPEYPLDEYKGHDPETESVNVVAENSYLEAQQDMLKTKDGYKFVKVVFNG